MKLEGLKTNPWQIAAVAEFSRLQSLGEVRRFLGHSSYYRRFEFSYFKIASVLQAHTQKGTEVKGPCECEATFQTLREKLALAPVLAYTCLEKPLVEYLWLIPESLIQLLNGYKCCCFILS